MSSEDRSILNRRGFFGATGGISLAAFLAACGGSSSSSSSSSAAPAGSGGGSSPASTAPAAPKFDPASEPDGPLQVFEWEGYDDKNMWASYNTGPYGTKSPLKFTFLDNDQQALAKVASGVNYDLMHPCIAYWPDWQAADLIQPFDTSLLPDLHGIPDSILKVGQDANGLQWHVPFDIGFSSLVYRADRVKMDTPSWGVLLDAAYKGRMSMYSDEVTIIKIGHLINNTGKLVDPNKMNTDEINAAADTMTKAAANLRNFWDSETATEDDFINGNIDVTYVWPDGYWKIKNHPKMKNVDIQYMWPHEGRLAWVCGLVLGKNTKSPGRSTLAVAAANEPTVAAWLTDAFQYSAAQKQGVVDLIKDKALIPAFSLNDPAAWAPPVTPGAHGSWFEHPIPNRAEYVRAGQKVKQSIGT